MGRIRDPRRDEAFEIYKSANGEINLTEIAAQLGVSDGTVRAWKNRDGWGKPNSVTDNNKNNATLQKKKRNATNETQRNKKEKKKQRPELVPEPVIEIENDELTDKQRLFCIYYITYWNAGKAAKKAGYNCSYPNGYYEIGSQLLKNPQVKKEVDRLKKNIVEGIAMEAMAVLQKYIDIAFTDITDYLSFGQKEVPVMTMFGPMYEGEGDDKRPVTKIVNFVDFKPSNEVDGTLISEVKQGKEGVSIKLADKMKALEKLEVYFDLLPDKFKRKVEEEKLKIMRERVDIERSKLEDDEDKPTEIVVRRWQK